MNSQTLQVKLSEGAQLPAYQTEHSAGLDIRTIETFTLKPLERRLAKTGLHIAIPEGCEGQIRPRSGLALKKGISMVNTPGTIDSDYRGEIGVILINLGNEEVHIEAGERIAQLVICPIVKVNIEEVENLSETVRGSGGFGSTGVK